MPSSSSVCSFSPRFASSDRIALGVKSTTVVLGSGLFVYANDGETLVDALPWLPPPATVLGSAATLALSTGTVEFLLRVTNSLLFGPPLVAAVAFGMNRLLTRPEVSDIPLVRHSLPHRDPWRVVVVNAVLGTTFYLGVVAVFGGRVVVIP